MRLVEVCTLEENNKRLFVDMHTAAIDCCSISTASLVAMGIKKDEMKRTNIQCSAEFIWHHFLKWRHSFDIMTIEKSAFASQILSANCSYALTINSKLHCINVFVLFNSFFLFIFPLSWNETFVWVGIGSSTPISLWTRLKECLERVA